MSSLPSLCHYHWLSRKKRNGRDSESAADRAEARRYSPELQLKPVDLIKTIGSKAIAEELEYEWRNGLAIAKLDILVVGAPSSGKVSNESHSLTI
jgi:hypothetical protein